LSISLRKSLYPSSDPKSNLSSSTLEDACRRIRAVYQLYPESVSVEPV
jgi:hypothetical protein